MLSGCASLSGLSPNRRSYLLTLTTGGLPPGLLVVRFKTSAYTAEQWANVGLALLSALHLFLQDTSKFFPEVFQLSRFEGLSSFVHHGYCAQQRRAQSAAVPAIGPHAVRS